MAHPKDSKVSKSPFILRFDIFLRIVSRILSSWVHEVQILPVYGELSGNLALEKAVGVVHLDFSVAFRPFGCPYGLTKGTSKKTAKKTSKCSNTIRQGYDAPGYMRIIECSSSSIVNLDQR